MIKKINTHFEKLFEQKNDPTSFKELKDNFVLSEKNSELENLSYIFSQQANKNDLLMLFSQLSSFFEVGFLLEKTHSQKYHALQIFAYAKHFQSLDGLQLIQLPQPELFKVLSTNAQNFLSHFHLAELDHKNRMNAFLMKISEQYSLIVMSSLAEPWLQLRIESLHQTLLKINFNL